MDIFTGKQVNDDLKNGFLPFDSLFEENSPRNNVQKGLLVFNFDNLTKQQKQQLYQKHNAKKLKRDDLSLMNISSRYFQLIKQTKQTQIYLRSLAIKKSRLTKKPQSSLQLGIIRQISHIKFSNLKILKLSSSSLTTIQNLSFLVAPNLRALQLYQSKITSIKPLAKASFHLLEVITLYNNYIHDSAPLCRGNYRRLTKYQLDGFSQRAKKSYIQDTNFLFKMQEVRLKKLYAQNQNRVYLQDKIFQLYKLNNMAEIHLSEKKFNFQHFSSMSLDYVLD